MLEEQKIKVVSHINFKEDTLGRQDAVHFNNRNCCVFLFLELGAVFFSQDIQVVLLIKT